ncbi:hypothetical protein CsatB_012721 [Cannabis sativa]
MKQAVLVVLDCNFVRYNSIRVADYFQQKYRIRLRYVTWPALQAGSANKLIY